VTVVAVSTTLVQLVQVLLLYYSIAAMTTVSAADASSVSASPAWCCSCCWHEQQVSSKNGDSQFWGPRVLKIYDTRLNGETLFSDFRWCHGELQLGMHGAADDAIAA